MHSNSVFTASSILWTLTFAAQLVLLVVLMGRDRVQRFMWFTISIVLMALRLLGSKLLHDRLPPLTLNKIFITLEDLAAVVSLMVLVEIARRAFAGVRRITWGAWTLGLLAVGATVLKFWGEWPPWKTMTADSLVAILRLMQLAAQKGELLADVLTVQLGLLVVVFGRRFKAGWRSHTQQIMIGLSTVALAQLAVEVVWQLIALKATPHSQAEYEQILDLGAKLVNGNKAVYVVVLVWWIVCLWIDEPGTKAVGEPAVEVESVGPETDGVVEAGEPESQQ
jgi:hypothetical protein